MKKALMTDYSRDHFPAAADARHAAHGGDVSLIPPGMYCYSQERVAETAPGFVHRVTPCPYWGSAPEKRTQQNGYCAHLKAGDWEEDGTFLLWDMVKECGENNDIDESEPR
jgi:hypothetical protein